MKFNIKSWCIVAAVLVGVAGVKAQNLQTGYFDENYLYRFQANPALGNDGRGFVAMPGIGNLNVGVNGNVGLNKIFYNINGETTTLLNPGISASKALSPFKEHTRIGMDLRENILAVGFKGLKGYNAISVSARASASIGLPKELIRLAKEGVSNKTYDLSNFGGTGRAWVEVALNHSHQVNKNLRVGATVKVLVGAGSFDANVNTANLRLENDSYKGEVNASMHASMKNFRWETDYNERTRRNYVSGADMGDFSPVNGFGVAFDLGAVYNFKRDWQFSLAFTDLGFISWNNNVVATTNGLQKVDTNSLIFNVDNNDSWDKFRDNLSMLYELEDKGDTGSRITGIGATMSAGVQYTLPVYRRLTFGLLNTTRINGSFSWTEFRLSANVHPVKCFSAGVNFGMGTFGPAFGGIINLKTTGFNLFVATDCAPFKLCKLNDIPAPVNSRANVNFGINFPF